MEVGPRDDVLAAGAHGGQVQPLQYRAEAHLDTDQFEAAAATASEYDVGHPGQPLAHDVDDLGVQHVAHQQISRSPSAAVRSSTAKRPAFGGVDAPAPPGRARSWSPGPTGPAAAATTLLDHQLVDQVRAELLHQVGRQVGEPADDRPSVRAHRDR